MDRRDFVKAMALSALPLGGVRAASLEKPADSSAPSRPESKRRVIWNNDGDDLRMVAFGVGRLWNARDGDNGPLPDRLNSLQEYLDLRMQAILDSPVDTISYCGVFTWPIWDFPRDRIAALGEDPLKQVIEFTHAKGKEIFFNLRMNDCHASGSHWQGEIWWEPFRIRNHEFLLSKISPEAWEKVYLPWIRGESSAYPLQAVVDRSGQGSRDVQCWSAYDYGRAEVREYFLGLIREACERYEIDGIDLDWLRFPFFFRFGQERRHSLLMNDFVRRVAEIVRQASKRRGKALVIAMRVPDSPERALEIGLDVQTWVAEGWVDLLIAGHGLAPFSMPLQPWRQLASARNIPVYGCVSRSAPGMSDPSALLGACHRLWENGVNGLYFFNHFIPSEYGTIRDAADTIRLKALPKTYAVDMSFTGAWNGTVFSGPLPLDFSTGAPETAFDLDLEIPEEFNKPRSARMSVRWSCGDMDARSRWVVNGTELRVLKCREKGGVEYETTAFKSGLNRLRVVVASSSQTQVKVVLEAVSVSVS